ncbi:MAG TPA: hypothetical protein PLZ12_11110 [Saprospiraceae bacterium]|nr:hypothetical protein [Saprospiraceae bacterium]
MDKIKEIEGACLESKYSKVFELLEEHFGNFLNDKYYNLKDTIMHSLTQGQMPNPAAREGLWILINDLKKNRISKQHNITGLCQFLLSQDFTSQKRALQENGEEKVGNFIVMHGTQTCGLDYFIMYRHKFHPVNTASTLIKQIKADHISSDHNGSFSIPAWTEIALLLNIEFDEHHEIVTHLKTQLKEKSIVVIFNNVERWGGMYLDNIRSIVEFWKEPPQITERHPLHIYFLRTDGQVVIKNEEKYIILPLVDEVSEAELITLQDAYKDLFRGCNAEISTLFTGPKKLAEVIEVFLEHSSCKDELRHILQLT